MEIIYHERRPNYRATIANLKAGEDVLFPWTNDGGINDPAPIRVICSKLEGKFTVNKLVNGLKVTRTA